MRLDTVEHVVRSPGRPLDPATRGYFEPRFGHDFSGVRVHTHARATESVGQLETLAYTHGNSIAFRTDAYAPDTPAGRGLLAHELAHVVQQRHSPGHGALRLGQRGDVAEQQADTAAHRVVRGLPSPFPQMADTAAPVVRRAPAPTQPPAPPTPPAWLGRFGAGATHLHGDIWDVQIASLGRSPVGPHDQMQAYLRDFNRNRPPGVERMESAHIIGGEHMRDLGWEMPYEKAPCIGVSRSLHDKWTREVSNLQSQQGPMGGRATARAGRPIVGPKDVEHLYKEVYRGIPELQEISKSIVNLEPRRIMGTKFGMPAPASPMAAHQAGMPRRKPPIEAHKGGMPKPASPMEVPKAGMPKPTSPMEAHKGGMPKPASPMDVPKAGMPKPVSPMDVQRGGMPKPASPMEVHTGGMPKPASPTDVPKAGMPRPSSPMEAHQGGMPATGMPEVAPPGGRAVHAGAEFAAIALLALQLDSVRGAEKGKAEKALLDLMPQIDQLRREGKGVTVTVVAEVPNQVDIAAVWAHVGDPGQVVYFKKMYISNISGVQRSGIEQQGQAYHANEAPGDPEAYDPHELPLDKQIQVQMGEKYPLKRLGPRPGFHFVSRDQHFPALTENKPPTVAAPELRGITGTYRPKFESLFQGGDAVLAGRMVTRRLRIDQDAGGRPVPTMWFMGGATFAYQPYQFRPPMVMSGRFSLGSGVPPEAEWIRSPMEYPREGLILEWAKGLDSKQDIIWDALFSWHKA